MIIDGQRITRIIFMTISLLVFALTFSIVLHGFKRLPQTIGYQFDEYGQYVNFGDKSNIFLYPLICILIFTLLEFTQFLFIESKTILSLTEKGEWIYRICIASTVGFIEFIVAAYILAITIYIKQQLALPNIMQIAFNVILLGSLIAILIITIICGIKYKEIDDDEK